MGKFTFKWDKPAEEVYVTGTFDNWTKSIKLEKEGDVFQKTVDIDAPETGKVYYKFVVDNNWVVSDSAPKEADDKGNDNNYLNAADLAAPEPAAAIINNVTADSTTAKLAGEQPLEEKTESKEPMATPSDIPGGFPATPANELDKLISVNPLPAADGAVNPIKLAPGEPVPESVSAQGVNEHVKLDEESYEKSDALAGVDTQLPPVTNATIPESSLPLGQDVTINSVGPSSTTAALAGEVPLEPKVPEVVKESQEKAGVEPEASAVPAEVEEKAKVESELLEKVPEAPAAAEGVAGQEAGGVAAALASAQETVASAQETVAQQAAPVVSQVVAAVAETANKNLPETVKESLPASVQEALASQTKEEQETVREEVSPEVPAEVKESITAAQESPEAAANTEAVQEKKEVEAELLKEVKPAPPADEVEVEEPKVEEPKIEEPPKVEEPKLEPALLVHNIETPKIEEHVVEPAMVEEPKPEEPKVEEPVKAEEPKVEEPVKAEEPKAAEPVNVETTNPAEIKAEPVETPANGANGASAANGANGSNGTTSAPAATETKPAETPASASASTKKKNRVSAFFSKIKHKLSDKS